MVSWAPLTRRHDMTGLFDNLYAFARRNPDRKAFSFCRGDHPQTVTYGELSRDLDRAARSDVTARPGELVLISSRTDYASILAYLSVLRIGAHPAYLAPLTPRQDPEVFHAELAALIGRFEPNRVIAETFADKRIHDRPFLEKYEPGFVQFSSGTTGLRKGVFISEKRLGAQLEALRGALGIHESDVVACWLPLYHDMGLITSLLVPLYFGCTTVFLDPVEWSYRPELLLEAIAAEQATLCWQPDFAFRHLVNRYNRADAPPVPRLDSLRLLVNCSEPCRTGTFARFRARFRDAGLREQTLQTSYALAENVFAVTQSNFAGGASWSDAGEYLSSGRVVPGCQVRVRQPDSAGDFGEVEIGGSCLFDGYLKHEQAPGRLQDGWFATGDLGYLENGELYVVGRSDDTLIVNGRKILAHQVEDHVGRLPGVRPGRVLCMAGYGGAALTIFYEGDELDPGAIRQVRVWCATAAGASVDQLRRVEAGTIVKSSSGKIARRKSIAKLTRLNLV